MNFHPCHFQLVKGKNEDEPENLLSKPSQDQGVIMVLDNYGFSKKFSWVAGKLTLVLNEKYKNLQNDFCKSLSAIYSKSGKERSHKSRVE